MSIEAEDRIAPRSALQVPDDWSGIVDFLREFLWLWIAGIGLIVLFLLIAARPLSSATKDRRPPRDPGAGAPGQ